MSVRQQRENKRLRRSVPSIAAANGLLDERRELAGPPLTSCLVNP